MTTIWVLVLLLFAGDQVADSKLAGFVDEASCKVAQKDLAAKARASDLDVWMTCVKVEHKTKPVLGRGGRS